MGAPPDRVRILKNERPSTGGTEDDLGFPAQLDPNEDAPSIRGFFLQGPTGEDKLVYVSRDASGNMTFMDVVDGTERTLTDLLAGAGITPSQHENLDSLVHWLSEDNYQEVTRTAGKVVNVTNWTDSGKTTKIREMVITRSAGKVSQLDFIQYDGAGTENQRMTGVITRTAGKISSVQWTETP